ncbi:lipopolysaccharide biosynthesis protein [Mammaliicoccus sciuri]|uniref:lipopolysaccharide biosynthesis protein n=1 Tax=Mammaliicoccus sciuri TaxID=1296 RepID=UPI001299D52A|nr:oligosaccharide flippase family protein [Mammaliicoccus sciuri]MRE71915.1 oligosaccharide flippase family protein [Mammaliicoccus sciuri]
MKRIFENLTFVFFANIINAISKFIFIIMITKYLSNTELGQYTLALAVTAPITLLFNMKLRSYIISTDGINFDKLKYIRNISNVLAVIFIFTICMVLYKNYLIVFLLVTIIKILEMNSEFYQGFPNKEKIFTTPAKIMIIRVVIITLVFCSFIYYTENLILALFSQVIIQFFILMIERKVNLKLVDLEKYNNNQTIKLIIFTVFPLGIVQALMSFSSSIPKYLLDIYGDVKLIGIFSAIVYLITIVNLFMSTLNQTLLPYIKSEYIKNQDKFNKTINIYCNTLFLIITLFLVILSFLIGEKLLQIVFNESFIKYNYLLIICAITIYFNMSGWMYDSALLISKKIKFQPLFLLVSLIITLIAGNLLISDYKILGAGITLLLFNLINTFFKALYFNIELKKGDE